MSFPARDESSVPMLAIRKPTDYDEDDIEENASDVSKNSSTTLYEKFPSSYQKRHSYGWSWSSTAATSPTKSSLLPVFLTWLRWSIVVGLQSIIILLLVYQRPRGDTGKTELVLRGKVVETGGDINGLYKTLSHTYTYLKPETEKFIPNMTSNENRMEVRRNWDLLMPLGSGSVTIPDYRDHPLLGDPITDDPIRSGPLFEASWTHALHCLYYSVDSYHQLIVNGPSEDDSSYHAAHCFEYLRNSILCNLDMTLEGSMSTPQDKETGQPHVCRNREEAIVWIEARRTDDLQDIVGP